jgi:hypothetical protein
MITGAGIIDVVIIADMGMDASKFYAPLALTPANVCWMRLYSIHYTQAKNAF